MKATEQQGTCNKELTEEQLVLAEQRLRERGRNVFGGSESQLQLSGVMSLTTSLGSGFLSLAGTG